jgi:segregation and condensation protein B
MSLKAKIEAVIYASEEPVTLAQLTGLLGQEGQIELDALAAQQQSLALEDESASDLAEPVEDADLLNAEILQPADDDGTAAESAAVEPESPAEAETPAAPDAKAVAAEAKVRERKLREYFRSLLDQLVADYATSDRGMEIREVAGGFRLATKPEYHDAVRGFVKSLKPPLKLTLQALETLAVVAYKQPVTAPEVSEIRGVESAGTLGSLMTRKLVTTAGRKQVIGRPILYKTTKDFLLRFGLKDINELPSMEEFEKMAGELNDAVQEEIPMEVPQNEADGGDGFEESLDGTSASVAEAGSLGEPTHVHHDTPEDLMSDKSIHPEGNRLEKEHPKEFEAMAAEHSAQADGEPEDESEVG